MTTRERFHKTMHWQTPDRVANMDFGYWKETIRKWHDKGLPEHIRNHSQVEHYLGLEGVSIIPSVPVINGLFPEFREEIIEESQTSKIIRDKEGNICRVGKSGTSIPEYIRYGLETRADWERLKDERLDYKNKDRIADVKSFVDKAHAAGQPVIFDAGSLYGWLRNWMGVENISITIMTERDWIEEMMEHLTEMTLYLIENSLQDADVDIAWWWEDMCYNKGPLISPKLFNDLMVPRYKRITSALKQVGIDINVLDCDGCIYELIPGWLEGGINCMFPIEAAHTDPFYLRQEYGRDLLLMGGVNKLALIQGKNAIDNELVKLGDLVQQGGYIPTIDHRVPADVEFDDYLYYLEKKKEILKIE